MSEFEKLKIVTRYELLKQYRRKRFYGALAITIFVVILAIAFCKGLNFFGRIGVTDSPELFAVFVTSLPATLAVLGAVFFAGDAIASEFEHKTGYILFPNPVKRNTLVIGKYLACFISTATILIMAYLISVGALLVFYRQVPVGILGSLAIALILACFVISMAFAFSSVLKGGMGATIATLLTYMVLFSVISSSLSYAGYDPWFMPDRAGDAMRATYGASFEQALGSFGGPMAIKPSDPILSFFVLLVYAVVFFLLSIWLTNRREMI